MLNSAVLVLNRSYLPVQITTVRRALTLLFLETADAIDEEWQKYDFQSWREISDQIPPHQRSRQGVQLVNGFLRIPRVLVLRYYNRNPRSAVRFCRANIYLRDQNTCQYCGHIFPKSRLNLDHVIPRSRGGHTNWENVVCSCQTCNLKKGGQTPEEARMALLHKPSKPNWNRFFISNLSQVYYEEWNPFLTEVDIAYWNIKLEES